MHFAINFSLGLRVGSFKSYDPVIESGTSKYSRIWSQYSVIGLYVLIMRYTGYLSIIKYISGKNSQENLFCSWLLLIIEIMHQNSAKDLIEKHIIKKICYNYWIIFFYPAAIENFSSFMLNFLCHYDSTLLMRSWHNGADTVEETA